MSIVISTITDEFVILCADKQVTNSKTGEVQIDAATKIEKWSSSVAISLCGNMSLCSIIVNTVRSYVKEEGIENFTLEAIAECFRQAYFCAKEEYNDMPSGIISKFIVAGKLSNGKVGAIEIFCSDAEVNVEIIEGASVPVTLIHEPDDLSGEECNRLFQKAISYIKKNNKYHKDPLEAVHRKTVRYVSELSKFVGYKSDYIIIKPDIT